MIQVNLVGRTKWQQKAIDAKLKEQGSLWPTHVVGIDTYDMRIWTFHLRRFARWYLRRTEV